MNAGVQDDGCFQPVSDSVPEVVHAAQVVTTDPGAGPDLEGDDLTVVALQHEVDFVPGIGAEVPGGDGRRSR